jgi:HNH endonuclease
MAISRGMSKVARKAFSEHEKSTIFAKTSGHCTYCGDGLTRDQYGNCNADPRPNGAWEVDHWKPVASPIFNQENEADYDENFVPACCPCNDEKAAQDGDEYMLRRVREKKTTNGETIGKMLWKDPHAKSRTPPSVG